MGRRRSVAIGLVAIAGLAGLGLGVTALRSGTSDTVDAEPAPLTVTVRSQQLSRDVVLDGVLEPRSQTIVHRDDTALPAAGQIAGISSPAAQSSGAESSGIVTVAFLAATPKDADLVAAQTTDDTTGSTTSTTPTTSPSNSATGPLPTEATSTTGPETTSPATTGPPDTDSTDPSTTTGPETTAPPSIPTDSTTPVTPPEIADRPQVPSLDQLEAAAAANAAAAAAGAANSANSAPTAVSSASVTAVASLGDVIEPGDALYETDGVPVLLLPGATPAWRTLETDVTGPDVTQLEDYLADLGYDVGDVDEDFTATTADAVSAWQADLGLDETGTVTVGSIVFSPAAVTVTDVHVAVGDELAAGDPVLDVAGADLQATLDVDAETVSLVRVGQEFELNVDDAEPVAAWITSVVLDPSGGATAVASLGDRPDVAVVPIDVEARRVALETDTILAVPASAVIKLDRGGYAVRRESGELVAVEVINTSGTTVGVRSTVLAEDDVILDW